MHHESDKIGDKDNDDAGVAKTRALRNEKNAEDLWNWYRLTEKKQRRSESA